MHTIQKHTLTLITILLWSGISVFASERTSPQYHYHITDHQGNIRLVVNASGSTVEQFTHYYPYGLPFAEGKNATLQPYKYNGKELDTEDGLNLYDYGARHYDAALCRWTSQDALAEKNNSQSPYSYCIGNPILFVDPCGKDTFRVSDNSRITQIQGGNNDVFINDNGKIITTTEERSANLINTDDKPFDILNFSNDKNAEKVFKAIADQSKNEWSLIETKGKGYISTSYKPSEELGGRHILSNKNYYIGLYNPILRHIHSHPKSMTLEPSGVDGDIGLVRYFMNVAGFEKTQWYIYGPQAGYFIQYHHNRDIMFKYIDEVFPWSR